MKSDNKLILFSVSEAYIDSLELLSKRLDISYTLDKAVLDSFLTERSDISDQSSEPKDKKMPLYLKMDEDGLSLTDGKHELRGDFTDNLSRLKQSNLEREMLVKAAKLKGLDHPPVLIDATAGMGEDSLLLAASGFNVKLYEYDPIIASLLEDALRRAKAVPELKDIVSRMELHIENSIEAMNNLDITPDVILLDPMFPARTKSSLVKKKFQLLQQLEPPCSDAAMLLNAAISLRPRKIIIKRPAKGPYLADIKPDYSLTGKAIRYDCILPETRKF
ncbi:SAM-dependent methyltransferase, tRNA(uracil-5)-methyltransferase [Lachnospiraceae bacterium JC7]|nr:SAM-dependent methyltransferase, tRNA(uracil-5)-methyltransferase [Lachnospiraceae bacterium JC7]